MDDAALSRDGAHRPGPYGQDTPSLAGRGGDNMTEHGGFIVHFFDRPSLTGSLPGSTTWTSPSSPRVTSPAACGGSPCAKPTSPRPPQQAASTPRPRPRTGPGTSNQAVAEWPAGAQPRTALLQVKRSYHSGYEGLGRIWFPTGHGRVVDTLAAGPGFGTSKGESGVISRTVMYLARVWLAALAGIA
jgi:hypothetical protein